MLVSSFDLSALNRLILEWSRVCLELPIALTMDQWKGFGIIKREMYYRRRYHDRETLIKAIEDYLDYYNNRRYPRKLMTLSPKEAHEALLAA